MSLTDIYGAYAAAFEETFADNDWARLGPFFTDNAVYKSDDEPFAFNIEGREAIQEHLKNSVDGFDRRFDSRTLELQGAPEERAGAVFVKWTATYTLAGAPDLHMEGTETATFDGDRICQLVDTFDAAAVAKVGAWMQEHGGKLPTP